MSTTLPPVPHQVSAGGGSTLPPVWSDWFKQLLNRVGGNVASSNRELADSITALSPKLVPTGTVLHFAGSAAPTGFLLCDGSAISRTTYAALFTAIGTTWGAGDGSTTFNLPPGGVFLAGKGGAGSLTALGSTGGAESQALPNHLHSVSLTSATPSATFNGGTSGGGTQVPTTTHTHAVSGNTGNPTASPGITTLPPYAVMNLIVKT